MKKHINSLSIVVIYLVLICASASQAAEKNVGLSAKVLNWSNPSQQQHFDNLFACEYMIQAHKWSKNIWPKDNKTAKPTFSEVVDMDQIFNKVLDDVSKENILQAEFNVDISYDMLQHDIDRMANNSKDPQGLKALFALFNNNPRSIAECISRPYLVNRKLQKRFDQSGEIHQIKKEQATQELKQYLKSGVSLTTDAQISKVTFKMKAQDKNADSDTFDVHMNEVIEVDEEQFRRKSAELNKHQIQETSQAFIYNELLEKSADSIKVKTQIWKKLSLDQWLKTQVQNSQISVDDFKAFKLPQIRGSKTTIDSQSGTLDAGFWRDDGLPERRIWHSTVWTGSEMIVWGGEDEHSDLINTGGRYDPVSDSWQKTSTLGAPTSRQFNTVVWTGTEMVVWGGQNQSANKFNTGGRYNPNTDTWQATNVMGAPIARSLHSAVWTGSEMIVYGGVPTDSVANTGGRYDPVNDSWQATSTIGDPASRVIAATVWTGSEMLVWGGSSITHAGDRYDPINDSWQPMSTVGAPADGLFPSVVWTGSEMIVWGGLGGSQSTLSSIGGRYNPDTDTWVLMSYNSEVPYRYYHSTVWTGDEMIVWGGDNLDTSPTGSSQLNSGGRYDPVTDSWEVISNYTPISNNCCNEENVTQHTAVWTGSEMIIWGGFRGGLNIEGNSVNSGGRYDPINDSWRSMVADEPIQRNAHSAVWTGNEMIVWGGHNTAHATTLFYHPSLQTGGRYDPVTDSWQITNSSEAPSGRNRHSAVWTGSEMIVWGGNGGHGGLPSHLSTGGRYNPITDSWLITSRTDTPIARWLHSAVWTGSEMIIWGGQDGNYNYMNTGGRYDPVMDSWQNLAGTSLSTRYLHTAVWTGNEMIVWGGLIQNSLQSNTGGRYDPESDSWQLTNTNTSNGPVPINSLHTSVWTGNEMIVWGGSGNDVYRYDPIDDSWLEGNANGAPVNRRGHTAVWTGSEMIVWGGGTTNTGGHYDPISDSWQSTSLENAPEHRADFTTVWTGRDMIIWGGIASDVNYTNMGIYYPDLIYRNGF